MMGDAADDLAHFEYRQANPLVWHDEEDEVTNKPMIERPPLEEWAVAPEIAGDDLMMLCFYALSLEDELARYKRYRERTRGAWQDDEAVEENEEMFWTDDIAKEEGIE